jgi:formylglycine-generating enzyme required for sulfatase activity
VIFPFQFSCRLLLVALLFGSAGAVEPDQVAVPAGPFDMGDEHGLRRDALPRHAVNTDAFLIDRCEVTAAQMAPALNWALAQHWIKLEGARVISSAGGRQLLLDLGSQPNALFLSNNVVAIAAGQERMPCVWITWHGALAYCAIRTAMENAAGARLTPCIKLADWSCDFSGTGYRLPTEAEWEKAARGGLAGQHFPWRGAAADFRDDISPSKANYIESIETAGNQPQLVGTHQLSRSAGHPWGLCDVAGNAAEWCWDWYDAETYTLNAPGAWPANPVGPPASPWHGRALRGGSWYSVAEQLRCAHRSHMAPDVVTAFVGFRTVRRPGPGPAGAPQPAPSRLAGGGREVIEADWLEQDFPELREQRAPDFSAGVSNAWKKCFQTMELVERQWRETGDVAREGQFAAWRGALEKLRPASDGTREHYLAIRRLRRSLLLASPLLQFESLAFFRGRPSKYTSNLVDSNAGRWSQAGAGVSRLDNWRGQPSARELFPSKLPAGAVQNMDLDFDARHVVFSFCSHAGTNTEQRAYQLFEGASDGTTLRQLTGDPKTDPLRGEDGWTSAVIEDLDPIYLPDGDVAFMSTRCASFSRCHVGRYAPSFVLYRTSRTNCEPRRLCYMESNEWTPVVLNDGRIAFTQWDYVNRHEVLFQGVWSCLPDGAALAHIYGNYTPNPCAVIHVRPVPGARELIAVAAGHHSLPGGSLIRLDPARGQDGEEPLTRLTPDICFPETEGWPCGSYMFPWPLARDVMFVSYSPDPVSCHWEMARDNAWGLYLFDATGSRELIWRDAHDCCFKPIPLVPRVRPPQPVKVASAPAEREATVIVRDVTRGVPLEGRKVTAIRVVQMFEQHPQHPLPRSVNQIEFARNVVGTATVQPDGSAAFRVPANAPLLFQLLDEKQRAVVTMRSQVFFRQGEQQSCVGCHENRLTTPPAEKPAWRGTVQTLRPPAGPRYAGGLSFARTVQPVLDRYCLRCHGETRAQGMPDLRSTPSGSFSTAYRSLTARPDLTGMAWRRQESVLSTPDEYGARVAGLTKLLETTHAPRVRLDGASWERLMQWLDLNCPYFGDYGPVRAERLRPSAAGEKQLRSVLQASCASCHAGLAAQPLQTLINTALPAESRVLQAPLSVLAGGWGQCRGLDLASRLTPEFQRLEAAVRGALAPPGETNTVDTASEAVLGCP